MLKALSIPEDVLVRGEKAPVLYVHRQTANEPIYWLNSRSDEPNGAEISFRSTGRVLMIWHPQTGKIESVSYRITDGRTVMSLHFDSWDAYFVVFGEPTRATTFTKPTRTETKVTALTTSWRVQFLMASGDPCTLTLDNLTSWTDNADAAVKYFSGTAAYQILFSLPEVVKNGQYILDLGEVKNMAEVIVNGKNGGIAWKKPFRLDITEAVKAGNNRLEIRVTNLWPNRLIGDAQPDAVKTTFTTMPFYQATSPLLPSGLLGPVQVLVSTTN